MCVYWEEMCPVCMMQVSGHFCRNLVYIVYEMAWQNGKIIDLVYCFIVQPPSLLLSLALPKNVITVNNRSADLKDFDLGILLRQSILHYKYIL